MFKKELDEYIGSSATINVTYENKHHNMIDFNGVSGNIELNHDGNFTIIINNQDDSKRQIFTLMHEYAHIKLEHI